MILRRSHPGPQRRPTHVRELRLSRGLLDATRQRLRSFPRDEDMVLWSGTFDGDRARARRLLTPPVQRSEGRVRISREDMKLVGRAMRARGELLVLQIHTHPDTIAFSGVDAAEAADQGAGAIAMVVHHYGQTEWMPTRDAVIYERDERGRWAPWRGKVTVTRC
jgi:proteasome lid subunit RPN8/RPN11